MSVNISVQHADEEIISQEAVMMMMIWKSTPFSLLHCIKRNLHAAREMSQKRLSNFRPSDLGPFHLNIALPITLDVGNQALF